MKRIPIIILIASILTGVIPILGYVMVGYSKMIPLLQFSRIIQNYNIFQILFNLFLVAVAIGMLRIQRWSFVSFILLSLALFIYSIIIIILSILGFSSYEFKFSDYSILFCLVAGIIIFIAYIIRKELSMPYFSILGRGWRLSRRESLPVKIEWNYELGQMGYGLTENISSKGCLLPLTESMEVVFLPGIELDIKLYFMDDKILKIIPVKGTVLRVEEKASELSPSKSISKAGIIFQYSNGSSDEKWVSQFLEEKYSPRFATHSNAFVTNEFGSRNKSESEKVELFNISRTGMYIISNKIPELKSEMEIEFPSKFGKIHCKARVVWINPNGLYGKPQGYGIQIVNVSNWFSFYMYLIFLAYLDDVRR